MALGRLILVLVRDGGCQQADISTNSDSSDSGSLRIELKSNGISESGQIACFEME